MPLSSVKAIHCDERVSRRTAGVGHAQIQVDPGPEAPVLRDPASLKFDRAGFVRVEEHKELLNQWTDQRLLRLDEAAKPARRAQRQPANHRLARFDRASWRGV